MAKRPQGEPGAEAYEGHTKWTRARWAWEFLRRHKKFQDACKAATSAETMSAVALEYGLTRFKHAKEPYLKDGSRPKFVGAVVTTKSRLEESQERKYRRSLDVGDLVLVMRLIPCIESPASMKAQLRAIEVVARRELQALAKIRGVKPRAHANASRIRDPHKWIEYLRVLDASAAKMSSAEIASLVYPEQFRAGSDDQAKADFIKERIATAREFAAYRYLDIAMADPERLQNALLRMR